MIILLQQSGEDETTNFIHNACKSIGIDSCQINIDKIGREICFENNLFYFLNTHKNITGIFNGVFRTFSREILGSNPGTKENFIANEIFDFLYGSLMSLNSDVLWMNHPAGVFLSSIKIHQLHVAKKVGFLIPDTIISNDSEKLSLFWRKHKGRVVTKAIHQGFLSSDKNKKKLIFTSKVEKHHLGILKEAIFIPILFQEFIRKKKEYRVVVIDKKVFSCVVSDKEVVDWRLNKDAVKLSYPIILPAKIQKLCASVVDELGLTFGVLDIVESTEGGYYFLEVNQQGGWLWMDKDLGLPISKELVYLLARKNKTSNI